MRPDEHKKKKNALYKKKHGIGAKPETNADKDKQSKVDRESSALHYTTPISATKCKLPASYASDSKQFQNDVEPIPESHHPSFSRRKIESNWQRYEIDENAESSSCALRGADMTTLLLSSANTLSQFQYKFDDDWQSNVPAPSVDSKRFLSIDCENLANALQTIPLHLRLNLDKSIFEPDQIQNFIDTASKIVKPTQLSESREKSETSNDKPPQDLGEHDSASSSRDLVSDSQEEPSTISRLDASSSPIVAEKSKLDSTTSIHGVSSEKSSDTDHVTSDLEASSTGVSNTAKLSSPSSSIIEPTGVQQSLADLEDELESLLSL